MARFPSGATALRILVVDDSPDDRALVAREIRKVLVDALIDEAGTEADFDRLVEICRWDVAVTDYRLRWSTGLDVFRRLRATFADLPVIMFTASGNEEIAVEALKEGLDDYITKTPKHFGRIPYAIQACAERRRHRRDIETALENQRRSEQRLLIAMEGARMASWDHDLATNQVAWSPSHFTMLGYPVRADGVGSFERWLERVHPDDRAALEAAYNRTLAEGAAFTAEYRIVRADNGEVRWMSAFGRVVPPVTDGGAPHSVGVFVDITGRKRQEILLAGQKEALELAQRGAPLSTVLEAIARTAQRNALHAADAAVFLAAPDGGVPRCVAATTKSPPSLERATRAQPIATAAGRALGTLAVYHPGGREPPAGDFEPLAVLAQRAAMLVERDEVAQEAERVAAQLRESEARLRESDQRKDEFLATLAHELRNPLAPIRNSLHVLGLVDSASPQGERVRAMMQRQLAHLVRLVDDLLEVARITRGTIDLRHERVALDEVLRAALDTSRPAIEHGGHALDVRWPAEPLFIVADPVRIAQVVSNLLNNAARYTDAGGHIELAAFREGAEAVICVRDDGIGIAAEHLPHLFRMFSQIDPSHARARGGLGIGLSLVQRLVELHGGRVEAHSAGPGHGSTFTVRLPLARSADAAPASPAPAHAPVAGVQRVLVVDDNEDAADSLAVVLRFLGAEVRVEYDGERALAAARAWQPTLAILDLGMPRMDGYELARRLRADPAQRRLPLVALTGWGQEQDRQRTVEAGFDHHLIKPVDPAVLETLLASIEAPGS